MTSDENFYCSGRSGIVPLRDLISTIRVVCPLLLHRMECETDTTQQYDIVQRYTSVARSQRWTDTYMINGNNVILSIIIFHLINLDVDPSFINLRLLVCVGSEYS